MNVNLSMDCLRSFVSIVEQGSFARAAGEVGRTAPAISLQMDRLQSQVGVQLFRKDGRNRVVTAAGIDFFEHARAILAQNDAALRLANADQLSGKIRLGIVQDFAEDFFPRALSSFAEKFANIRIDVVVERSQFLLEMLEKGDLDQVIAFNNDHSGPGTLLRRSEMVWIGKAGTALSPNDPIPMVVVDGPCQFRKTAFQALSDMGRSWDIRLSSPSMACVTAAAEAGLGIAVRTPDVLYNKGRDLAQISGLPELPPIDFQLYRNAAMRTPANDKLYDYWISQFRMPLAA